MVQAVGVFEREVAAYMIRMMMGVPNLGERPSAFRTGRLNLGGFGRIDGSSLPAISVMDQQSIII